MTRVTYRNPTTCIPLFASSRPRLFSPVFPHLSSYIPLSLCPSPSPSPLSPSIYNPPKPPPSPLPPLPARTHVAHVDCLLPQQVLQRLRRHVRQRRQVGGQLHVAQGAEAAGEGGGREVKEGGQGGRLRREVTDGGGGGGGGEWRVVEMGGGGKQCRVMGASSNAVVRKGSKAHGRAHPLLARTLAAVQHRPPAPQHAPQLPYPGTCIPRPRPFSHPLPPPTSRSMDLD